MPAISADNLTRLRTTIHGTKLGLVVYAPPTIWSGQINGNYAQGATTIAVDGVTQVRAPAKNYQVLFGSTTGARDLGEARFKSYAAPNLVVGAHNAILNDNTYITIKEEIKPTAIHVNIDDNDIVSEDGNVAYTDESVQYQPLARIGCPAVAYRDPATGNATVKFFASPVAMASGATITGHAWDFKDGSPSSSNQQGSEVSPIEVVFSSAGARYIAYTTTDSNGKTHTRYVPVFVFDHDTGTLPYKEIEVSGMEVDLDGGSWKCSLKAMTDATASAFPPNALVVLSAEDWFDDEKVSLGGQWPYRENIVLVGYIRRGSVKQNWAYGYVTFEVEGVGGVMDNLLALAFTLETKSADNAYGWHVLDALTFNRAAHHLLTQHSTVTQVADVHLELAEYLIEFLDFTEASLREQLTQMIAAKVRGVVGSSAQGMLYLQTDPQLLPLSERTHAVVLATTNSDWRDEVDLGAEEMDKKVSQVDFVGEDGIGDPIFALAPETPHPTGRALKVDGLRVDSQAEANEIAGLCEGKSNNTFDDVTLGWRGNYRVFDCFPIECVHVNISANQNWRGLAWTNQRCWTKRVSYEYRPGILLVTTVVAKDSFGNVGIAGDYPIEPPIAPPYIPPPAPMPDPYDPPLPVYPGGDETGAIRSRVYVATNAGIFYTSDFTDVGGAMPTWSRVETGLPTNSMVILTADPLAPSGTQYCVTNEYFYSGVYSNRVYRRQGGTWTKILDNEALIALYGFTASWATIETICTDISLPGYLAVIWNYVRGAGGQTFYYVYSTDYGATWQKHNTIPIGTNYNGACNGFAHGAFRGSSSVAAGQVVYCSSISGGGGINRLWISTDHGATWVERANFASENTGSFALQIDYWQDTLYCYSASGIKRSPDRGATWALINAAIADLANAGQQASGYALTMPCFDNLLAARSNKLMAIGFSNKLYRSENAGVSWTPYTNSDNAWGTPLVTQLGAFAMPDADGKLYGIGIGGYNSVAKVKVSNDYGVTWDDKAGADTSDGTLNGIPKTVRIVGLLPIYA